jgi:hypothetical protein
MSHVMCLDDIHLACMATNGSVKGSSSQLCQLLFCIACGSGHRSINGREDHERRSPVLLSMPYAAAYLTLESQRFNIDAANRLNDNG